MRVTTAFKRLLRLDGVNVVAVEFLPSLVAVTVALRRRRLICPHCGHKTRFRYDIRPCPSSWRHLDLGTWPLEIRATLRRLRCPTHGVVVEAVPFARPGAHLTADVQVDAARPGVVTLHGVGSVAEAAALAAAGIGASLVLPRLILGPVTCALARGGEP